MKKNASVAVLFLLGMTSPWSSDAHADTPASELAKEEREADDLAEKMTSPVLMYSYDNVTDEGSFKVSVSSFCAGNPDVIIIYLINGDPNKQRSKISAGPFILFTYQTDEFEARPRIGAGSFVQGGKRSKLKFGYYPKYSSNGSEAQYLIKVSKNELQKMARVDTVKADTILRLYTDCYFDDEIKKAIKVFLTAPAFARK